VNLKVNDLFASHRDFQKNSEREIEQFVGIDLYSTSHTKGIGGIYKNSYKDFIVKEITNEGKILEIKEDVPFSIFDETQHNYTTFNLVKINRDTFEIVRILSRALKIPIGDIFYSGLKDKLSLSIQQVSIKGNYIEKLKKFKYQDVFVRSIIPTNKPVKIGTNWGNNFTITIRNINPEENQLESIQNILKHIQEYGFPNYYGLQRFGKFRPNSHLVGRYILEGKFKEAFEEMVTNTYSTEDSKSQKIRRSLSKTKRYEKIFEKIPRSLNYERMLIKSLIDYPRDYETAVKNLPLYLLKLLISSFQSYLFNKLITLRAKKGYSLFEPETGDTISILDDQNGHLTKVKYVYGGTYDKYLREAISLNRARIVIPLIGYDTKIEEFPLINDLLKDLYAEENINSSIFKNPLLIDYDFKGTYRSMMAKPMGLNLLEYGNDDEFKKKKKLKLEFSLKKGSYATMLLRELMK
jgi:tRNA pseudouridine13 synthase